MTNTALYLRLLSHVRPHWRVFTLGCLGMMIVAATEPALPALMKPLIEGTFIDKDPQLVCCELSARGGIYDKPYRIQFA